MVQSYDSKGKERKQRKEMEGKMVWEGERNNTTGMHSYAFRQGLSVRCGL